MSFDSLSRPVGDLPAALDQRSTLHRRRRHRWPTRRRCRMATFGLIVLAATLVVASPVVGAAGSTRVMASRCLPHHTNTIIQMGGGRIYDFPAGISGHSSNPKLMDVYGCLFSRGHPYALDDPFGPHSGTRLDCIGPPRLACSAISAPYAAYGVYPNLQSTQPRPPPPVTMRIMDLRSGRVIARGPMVRRPEGAGLELRPDRVAVSSSGVAAWTVNAFDSNVPGSENYVNALDRNGWHEIAAAPGIDPAYVRVIGRTVEWRQDGQLQSTTLPRHP